MHARRALKAVFSCSLALVLAVAALAAPDADAYGRRLARGEAFGEGSAEGQSAGDAIREIKSQPKYNPSEEAEASNWLEKALERLGDLIPEPSGAPSPAPMAVSPIVGQVIVGILAVVLAALVVFLLFLLIRSIRFRRRKRNSRGGALLEHDEPLRSADEWLSMANALEQEGRYREAARCLYLAILMRCDENGIARFVRSETNWEHAYRIQDSPNRPEHLDIRDLTARFDRAWYGYEARSTSDVAPFREAYQALLEDLAAGRRTA